MITSVDGPLYIKSFMFLVRAVPLWEKEARKWSIGNGFNDYRLLSDYLVGLTQEDKELITRKAHYPELHTDSEMPRIDELFLPIVERGGFPPDEELLPLMEKFGIKDKDTLEMTLYWFLFRTTNHGAEVRVA